MPSSSISASPTVRPSGPIMPVNALERRISSSRASGRAVSMRRMISSEIVEHDTMVNSLPSNECATARSRIASAMSYSGGATGSEM